ncbi:MAG: substrate-binding domain-containing protein [Pirellulaceae bacterium]
MVARPSSSAGTVRCQRNAWLLYIHRCQESGLRIPEDIALLDVDNDELLSKLSKPPNSSVALATHHGIRSGSHA